MTQQKYIYLIALGLVLRIGASAQARSMPHVWLMNSRGETVDENDSIVSRYFFDCEWLDVRSEPVMRESIPYYFVLRGLSGEAMAIKPATNEIDQYTLTRVKEQRPGTKVILIFQPTKEQVFLYKRNPLTFRLL